MRFDYSAIISSAPDTGEAMVIFRPEVRVVVHGPERSADFWALVDTGADNIVLPKSVAHALGLALTAGKGPAVRAFGGQEIAISYADVDLELVHPDGNVRWSARVYFHSEGADEETLILGHQGFLDYFTAVFNGEDCAVDLEPNDYLPGAAAAD